jgi:hypothetical protein
MTTELISKFIDNEVVPAGKVMRIEFKKRSTIYGMIVKARDYEDLSAKNFWRIVFHPNLETWNRTKNLDVAKIYNGAEINKITIANVREAV